MNQVHITTLRFFLRSLTDEDATERYSKWFDNPAVVRHITAARYEHDVDALRKYITQRMNRPDVLFLGIFLRESGLHIGNLKFEPIDRMKRTATLGIMIGDTEWRGRGVAHEAIMAATEWIKKQMKISRVFLGVHSDNLSAQRAYQKCGFVPVQVNGQKYSEDGAVSMVLNLDA